jgi:hypothetical protein
MRDFETTLTRKTHTHTHTHTHRVKVAMKKILNKAHKSSRDLKLEKKRAQDIEEELKRKHELKVKDIRSKHEKEMQNMARELKSELERTKRELLDHEKMALDKAKEHERLVLKSAFEHERQAVYELKSEMDERIANALQKNENDENLLKRSSNSILGRREGGHHNQKLESLERIVQTHRELLRQSISRLEAFRKIFSV